MSCVMTIQLPAHPEVYILKLYDRRFAEQVRRDEQAEPWDPQVERRYQSFLRTGEQKSIWERWSNGYRDDVYYRDEQDEEWTPEVTELFLQFVCQHSYETEKHAYDLMQDPQGVHVPKLHYDVTVPPTESLRIEDDASDIYTRCPGTIFQYIEGFALTDIENHLPREYWQEVCDTAISIIHQIGDRGISNRDVKTRSFILRPVPCCAIPQVFMTDFGTCVFRDRLKDEHEFREFQADEDEEGAIGRVMERSLEGGYKYQMSARARRLLRDFKSEHLPGNGANGE